MAEKRADIIIGARDEASAVFGKVVANARAASEKMRGMFSISSGGSAVEGLAKLAAGVGQLEAGLRAVGAAAKALKGDWTGAYESIRRMPLVGSAVEAGVDAFRSVYDVSNYYTGGGKLDELRKQYEAEWETSKQQVAAVRSMMLENAKLAREAAIAALDGPAAAIAKAQTGLENQLATLEAEREKALASVDRTLRGVVQQQFDERRRLIEQQTQFEIEQIRKVNAARLEAEQYANDMHRRNLTAQWANSSGSAIAAAAARLLGSPGAAPGGASGQLSGALTVGNRFGAWADRFRQTSEIDEARRLAREAKSQRDQTNQKLEAIKQAIINSTFATAGARAVLAF